MKPAVIILTLALAATLGWGLNRILRTPDLPDLRPVYVAAQAYQQALVAQGRPVPATVSLPDLTREGFFDPKRAAAFDGYEVTVSLTADEHRPQGVLMRVRLPKGDELVVLCDGSVQSRRGTEPDGREASNKSPIADSHQ
jgi:hypothetical protein